MIRFLVGLIAVLAAAVAPALAQDQAGARDRGESEPIERIERIETPEGTVTIVRPTPRVQPAARGPQVNPDPVPPPPPTPFLTDQLGSECWHRRC